MIFRRLLCAVVASGLLASRAEAGPWTRDGGDFYLSTYYSRTATTTLYGSSTSKIPIAAFEQHSLNFYGEVGLLSRWLTATLEGVLLRYNSLEDRGATYGLGDFRIGMWTGLLTKPLHLSLGVTFGLPLGDSSPKGKDADSNQIARILPTSDGEFDIEYRLSLGYAFGGGRKWPLRHYLIAEAGYWMRTKNLSDSFVYKLELGVRLPWRVIERLTASVHLTGVESFADNKDATLSPTGLGNGVTYTALGADFVIRVWRKLGIFAGVDGNLRGRSISDAVTLRTGISWGTSPIP